VSVWAWVIARNRVSACYASFAASIRWVPTRTIALVACFYRRCSGEDIGERLVARSRRARDAGRLGPKLKFYPCAGEIFRRPSAQLSVIAFPMRPLKKAVRKDLGFIRLAAPPAARRLRGRARSSRSQTMTDGSEILEQLTAVRCAACGGWRWSITVPSLFGSVTRSCRWFAPDPL
jgi:hypothetical protein